MLLDYGAFERTYGRRVPSVLKTLYENLELIETAPVRFTFPDKPFVVEIQSFRAITELNVQDVEHDRFAFAVNSDGFEMLVDLTETDLPILQREFANLDEVGVTLVELLAASHHRVRKEES